LATAVTTASALSQDYGAAEERVEAPARHDPFRDDGPGPACLRPRHVIQASPRNPLDAKGPLEADWPESYAVFDPIQHDSVGPAHQVSSTDADVLTLRRLRDGRHDGGVIQGSVVTQQLNRVSACLGTGVRGACVPFR
jgi:hypothetical protein